MEDLFQFKMLYTLVAGLLHTGALSTADRKDVISAALQQSVGCVTSKTEYAITHSFGQVQAVEILSKQEYYEFEGAITIELVKGAHFIHAATD